MKPPPEGLERLIYNFDKMQKALRDVNRIVRVPTSKTSHKSAQDHFQSDFDAIRKITAPFVSEDRT